MQSVACELCACLPESCETCKLRSNCTNCISCCCTQTHVMWRQARIRRALFLEYFSVGWMGVEVLGSIIAGIIASSLSLIAFGSDSMIEMLSAFVVLRHLRSDSGGSTALGRRTAYLSSYLLFALIPTIAIASIYSYFVADVKPEASPIGLVVAISAVIIMPILWIEKRKIGAETNCLPLSIDALESATCFLMSLALLGGLLINYFFKLPWIDYVATAIILGFIAKEAFESFHEVREN